MSEINESAADAPFRLLIVDDDSGVRQLIAELLSDEGYAVADVAEAAPAIALLRAERFDLLITDLGLPGGMTGQQLAASAKALQPNLKILAITGYTALPVPHAEELDLLSKPFSMTTLLSRVNALLG